METYFDCDIVTVRTLLRKVAFFSAASNGFVIGFVLILKLTYVIF